MKRKILFTSFIIICILAIAIVDMANLSFSTNQPSESRVYTTHHLDLSDDERKIVFENEKVILEFGYDQVLEFLTEEMKVSRQKELNSYTRAKFMKTKLEEIFQVRNRYTIDDEYLAGALLQSDIGIVFDKSRRVYVKHIVVLERGYICCGEAGRTFYISGIFGGRGMEFLDLFDWVI